MTIVQAVDAGRQAREDAIAWLKNKNCRPIPERELSAYEAGHAAGWREAIAFLRLHGAIKLD